METETEMLSILLTNKLVLISLTLFFFTFVLLVIIQELRTLSSINKLL